MNLYHVSLKFTSATVLSATDNSLPAITFFLALLLRSFIEGLIEALLTSKLDLHCYK
jgi:hypothetical protein